MTFPLAQQAAVFERIARRLEASGIVVARFETHGSTVLAILDAQARTDGHSSSHFVDNASGMP